jgi:hypothetical protein
MKQLYSNAAWHNADDPVARQGYQRRLAQADRDQLASGVTEPKRYTDAGELKYNLRALESNAPWVRTDNNTTL